MQENGLREDQVTQIRGYADQNLRKPNDPFDPSNRRITLIIQYIPQTEKPEAEEDSQKATGEKNKAPDEKPAPK